MQANRALASRLGVRENRSKSPPLAVQYRPKPPDQIKQTIAGHK